LKIVLFWFRFFICFWKGAVQKHAHSYHLSRPWIVVNYYTHTCSIPTTSSFYTYTFGDERYLTIKRRNQTFCLLCEDTETIRSIQEKLAQASNQHSTATGTAGDQSSENDKPDLSADDIRLLRPPGGGGSSSTDNHHTDEPGMPTVIKEEETIQDLQLPKDKAILYMVHRISDDDTWESVDVVSTAVFDAT
jgi:hypothetical protein